MVEDRPSVHKISSSGYIWPKLTHAAVTRSLRASKACCYCWL